MKTYPTVSQDPAIQAEYIRIRETGESHLFAEMCAFAQPPGVTGTERAFLEGHCNGSQFAGKEAIGNAYAEDAKAAGVSTKGKVYKHALARFPGDPEAWVSGISDAKRVIEERGWGSTGSVNVKMTNIAEPTGGGVADDIVDRHTEAAIESAPEPVKDVVELREQVKANLMPHWAK